MTDRLSFVDWLQKNTAEMLETKAELERGYNEEDGSNEISKDPEIIDNAIATLIVYLSRSCDLQAEAEYYYIVARGKALIDYAALQPSIAKMRAEADASEEGRVFKLLERRNAAITHALECLRSRLSYQKQLHVAYGNGK